VLAVVNGPANKSVMSKLYITLIILAGFVVTFVWTASLIWGAVYLMAQVPTAFLAVCTTIAVGLASFGAPVWVSVLRGPNSARNGNPEPGSVSVIIPWADMFGSVQGVDG
jgi:hypothetical protein